MSIAIEDLIINESGRVYIKASGHSIADSELITLSGIIGPNLSGCYRIEEVVDDTDVALQIEHEGVDESTSFSDDSSYNHDVNPSGTAEVDTSLQAKGVSSGYFESLSSNLTSTGGNSQLVVPDHDIFDLNNTHFTFETYLYLHSLPSGKNIYLYLQWNTTNSDRYQIILNEDGMTLQFIAFKGLTSNSYNVIAEELDGSWDPSRIITTGQWYHIAFVHAGVNNSQFYVDKVAVDNESVSGGASGFPSNIARDIQIGVATGGEYQLDRTKLTLRALDPSEFQQPYFAPASWFILKTVDDEYVDGSSLADYVSGGRITIGCEDELCPYISAGQVRKMVTTISGLDHLEGLVVKAQTDGVVPETNEFTVSSGQITLPEKVAVAHVGLGYDGILKFLKDKDRNPQERYPSKLRIYLVAMILSKTLGLKVGLDEDNLSEFFDDSPALPLFTGEYDKLPTTTWDEEAELIIKQEKPLPAHVLSVVTRSEFEDKY